MKFTASPETRNRASIKISHPATRQVVSQKTGIRYHQETVCAISSSLQQSMVSHYHPYSIEQQLDQFSRQSDQHLHELAHQFTFWKIPPIIVVQTLWHHLHNWSCFYLQDLHVALRWTCGRTAIDFLASYSCRYELWHQRKRLLSSWAVGALLLLTQIFYDLQVFELCQICFDLSAKQWQFHRVSPKREITNHLTNWDP